MADIETAVPGGGTEISQDIMPPEEGGIKGWFESLPWWGWLAIAAVIVLIVWFLFFRNAGTTAPGMGYITPTSGGGGGSSGTGGTDPGTTPLTNPQWAQAVAPGLAQSLGMSVNDVVYYLTEWLNGNALGSAYYNKVVNAAQQLSTSPPTLPTPTAGAFTNVGQWWANAQMFLNEAGVTTTQAQALNSLVNNPQGTYSGSDAAGLQAAIASLEQWVGYIPADLGAWFTSGGGTPQPPPPSLQTYLSNVGTSYTSNSAWGELLAWFSNQGSTVSAQAQQLYYELVSIYGNAPGISKGPGVTPTPTPQPPPSILNLFNTSNYNIIPGGATASNRIPVLTSWFPDLSASQVNDLSSLFHVYGGGNAAMGNTNPFNGWSSQQIIDFYNYWLGAVRGGTASQLITQYQKQFNYYA